MAATKTQTLDEAWSSLEETLERKRHRDAVSVLKIPNKVPETQGMFTFGGYVARSRAMTCQLCGGVREECLGIFSLEHHASGGRRYTLATQWPSTPGTPLMHEVERVEEPFCFRCVQELGFTEFVDLGERRYVPQQKLIESGNLHTGTARIVPKSVSEALQRAQERGPRKSRVELDADEMLRELGAGDDL